MKIFCKIVLFFALKMHTLIKTRSCLFKKQLDVLLCINPAEKKLPKKITPRIGIFP